MIFKNRRVALLSIIPDEFIHSLMLLFHHGIPDGGAEGAMGVVLVVFQVGKAQHAFLADPFPFFGYAPGIVVATEKHPLHGFDTRQRT